MALGSQCLWFLVVWFWIWERECWNWGGIGLKHLTCQSVKKKTFPSFASNFSLNKNNLKWVAKMNVTPNTRGGANNGKLYWKLFTLLVHLFFKIFNGDNLIILMEICNMTILNPRIRWSSGQKVLPLLAWCLVQNSITDSLCTLLLVYWNNNGAWRFPRSFGFGNNSTWSLHNLSPMHSVISNSFGIHLHLSPKLMCSMVSTISCPEYSYSFTKKLWWWEI